jgi:hypothetical protein
MVQPKHHNRRGVLLGGTADDLRGRSMGMTCWYANGKQPHATIHLDVLLIEAVQIASSSRRSARSCGAHDRSSSCWPN